ncbi:MAG: GNAT family N-acetyltransferase [Rikenellaceae bacterium]
MKIIKATAERIDEIMAIYDSAREFMVRSGNAQQWVDGYPSKNDILRDIELSQFYLCVENDEIVAQFCYFVGEESSYNAIYDGEWLNDMPYGVVHRIASSGKVRKIADYCLNWCFKQHPNMKIDTHSDNLVMQNVLLRLGYKRCGTIYLSSGDSRIAFQKVN